MILTCKSIVKCGYRGERIIKPFIVAGFQTFPQDSWSFFGAVLSGKAND